MLLLRHAFDAFALMLIRHYFAAAIDAQYNVTQRLMLPFFSLFAFRDAADATPPCIDTIC